MNDHKSDQRIINYIRAKWDRVSSKKDDLNLLMDDVRSSSADRFEVHSDAAVQIISSIRLISDAWGKSDSAQKLKMYFILLRGISVGEIDYEGYYPPS